MMIMIIIIGTKRVASTRRRIEARVEIVIKRGLLKTGTGNTSRKKRSIQDRNHVMTVRRRKNISIEIDQDPKKTSTRRIRNKRKRA